MITASFLSDLANAWEHHHASFWPQTFVFLSLTLQGLGLALFVGLPTGILLSRLPRVAGPVIAVLAVLQTVPSLVLVGLLIPWLGIGPPAALFAAVAYCLFPIVLNTCVGITQVSPAVRDAARGMGMTGGQILRNVELPLALPVVLAGVRSGAVYASGIITIGALVGAGGLGDFIFTGLSRGDNGLMGLGALPILALTLLLFWGLGFVAWLSKKNSTLGMALGGGLIVALSGYAVYALAEPAFRPRRAEVRIGAKDFIEGQILAEILKQMVEAHTDLRAEITRNLGTTVILKAIENGDIDLYPEYTGVLLTNKEALGLPVPADKSTITALVRDEMRRSQGLVLLETFGLNNTYALCVTKATARRHGLRKISDLPRAPQLRVVVDLSFLERPDGWRGLVDTYELRFDQPPRQVGPDLLYRALENDEADLVVGFATDWQIASLDLVVLEDDRGYFPSYLGAPLVREAVLRRHPELRAALDRLAGRIDYQTMRRLNYQVAVEKRSEAAVAREFLQREGLLER